jgi:uncharacterized protein YdhG (YjbR/CyaY superfamily)
MAVKVAGKRPTTVAEYINAAPKAARGKLREMRRLIAACAPGAVQSLKWGMPTFSYKRILVSYAAFKKHIGFFVTSETRRAFDQQLAGFKTASSSVQFPLDQPLPAALIRRMVRARVVALKARDAKWRTAD